MSAGTRIEWTDATWTPLRARHRNTGKVGHYCEMVSPGCSHCYASRFQPRFGLPMYKGVGHRQEALDVVKPFLDESVLKQPFGWKKPRRVFVASMTDLFGDWVNNEWLHRVFAAMALNPRHQFQVLTKRAERMREYMASPDTPRNVSYWMAGGAMAPALYKDYTPTWPPPNVWLGVSVEDQRRKDRIDILRATPATVRFLSLEPLLEDLGQVDLRGIRWVILGGESGPGARPCHLEWLCALVAQCKAAEVACFVKQLGAAPVMSAPPDGDMAQDQRKTLRLRDKKGGDMEEFPPDLQIREFPEALANPGN